MESCCALLVRDITLAYDQPRKDQVTVIKNFSYKFSGGKIYVIMGSNGSGKSSLMRALAGELRSTGGTAELHCLAARHYKTVEYLPQDYRQAIFPWKRVAENVSPWWTDEMGQADREAIAKALHLVNLASVAQRFPYELSGGQQQLFLIARSLVSNARIILLDEPFSALDVIRRSQISEQIRRQWLSAGNIVICAMHEPDEAINLGDEILVMSGPPLKISTVISRNNYRNDEAARADLVSAIHLLASRGDA